MSSFSLIESQEDKRRIKLEITLIKTLLVNIKRKIRRKERKEGGRKEETKKKKEKVPRHKYDSFLESLPGNQVYFRSINRGMRRRTLSEFF